MGSVVTTNFRKPRMKNVFYKWFWDTYDNLGIVILSNVVWFIVCLPTLFILLAPLFQSPGTPLTFFPQNLFLLLPTLLLSAPITAGLFHLTYIMVQEREAKFLELFVGFKMYFKKSVFIALIITAIVALLLVAIQFYARLQTLKFLGLILSFWCLWGIIFLGLLLVYLFPILVQKGGGIKKIFKQTLFLVLDNIGYTLKVVMLMAVLVGLGIFLFIIGSFFPLVGLVFLTMSLVSILLNNVLTEVWKKYEEKEIGKKEKLVKPTSWKEIRQIGVEEVEESPRRRGWRDIFRPWKM